MEPRNALDGGGLLSGHRRESVKRISFTQVERPGLDSYERIARQPFTTLDALEQEARLARRTEQGVGPDRGQHVGQDFAVDRDQRVVFG
jgi:hypothetical protein